MKTLIFLSSSGNNKINSLNNKRGSTIFVPLNIESKEYLANKGVPFIDFTKYMSDIDDDESAKEVFAFLFKWEQTRFLNQKSIVEFASYENISLWWVLRRPFYHWIFESLKLLKLIDNIILKEMPDIVLSDGNAEFNKILENVCKRLGISFRIIPKHNHLAMDYFSKFKKLNEALKLYGITSLRVIQGFKRYNRFLKSKNHNKIFILTNSFYWQLTRDIKTGGKIKDDVHFGELAKLLIKNNIGVVIADLPKKPSTAWRSYKEKTYPFVPWEFFLFNGMINNSIRKKIKTLKKELRIKWKILSSNKHFKQSLKYKDIDIWEMHKKDFYNYFNKSINSFASFFRNIEIAKSILCKSKIKLCLVTEELGSGLHFIFASKLLGVKCIGMQHGIFGEISPNIIYPKEELCYSKLEKGKCPLPDYTIVYGQHFKEILTKINYMRDSVIVCGNPRTDIAFNKDRVYKKSDIYKKYGIEKNKKIIMFATSRNENQFEYLPIVEAVYKAASGLSDVQIIHKLHPSEGEDINKYNKMMKLFNIKVIMLRENIDLYEIINASDIVISWLATSVVAESLIFKKPVITVDVGGKIDTLGYKSSNVVINVSDAKQLKETIEYALNNKEKLIKEYAARRNKFIKGRFNKIDGKVNERILIFLKKLICG